MRIYRFDEEVGVPRRDVGVGVRVSPVTGDDSRAQVDVVHVAPGGSILMAGAAPRQFLGVLTGAGRAVGAGIDRELGPGYGALWEPGESGEVHSEVGLRAVLIQGDFELRAVAVTQEITVHEYDPQWPHWFEELRSRIWPAVSAVAVRIDHVGSTSVPGLAAKPIIDMDVVVAAPADVEQAIARLEAIGYRWRGDLGITGREAFRPPPDAVDPPHHLYVVVENNKAHLDHWLFRDLLRGDADAKQRYAALKRRNQELAAGDMDYYVAAKAALVAELLTRARAEQGLPPASYWQPDVSQPGR